jgi:hypothetical protein
MDTQPHRPALWQALSACRFPECEVRGNRKYSNGFWISRGFATDRALYAWRCAQPIVRLGVGEEFGFDRDGIDPAPGVFLAFLDDGFLLIVLPQELSSRRVFEKTAAQLKSKGKRIATISAEHFA